MSAGLKSHIQSEHVNNLKLKNRLPNNFSGLKKLRYSVATVFVCITILGIKTIINNYELRIKTIKIN